MQSCTFKTTKTYPSYTDMMHHKFEKSTSNFHKNNVLLRYHPLSHPTANLPHKTERKDQQ